MRKRARPIKVRSVSKTRSKAATRKSAGTAEDGKQNGRAEALQEVTVDPAADAGFADQSHLGRAFRSHFGTTPNAYRRAMRRRFWLRSELARIEKPRGGKPARFSLTPNVGDE